MTTQTKGSRRANGEGLIRQRPDGRWEGRIMLPSGKTKSVYAKTQKETQRKLQDIRQQVSEGRVIGTPRQTLQVYLEDWLENWVQPKARHRTFDTYQTIVRTYLVPALGRSQLGRLTAEDVQRFLNDLGTKPRRKRGKALPPVSPRTVQACRDVLRIALNRAVKRQLIRHNVARDTEPPSVEKRDVPKLTRERADAILAAFRGTAMEALVTTAITLGLRRGELLGLRWSDVDVERGAVHVRQQVQRQGGAWTFVPPKSKEGRRSLPLPAFLADVLHVHRARQLEQRLRVGAGWTDYDLVFPTEVGTPQDGMNVTHRFQARLKRMELPPMRFHDLRHGAATILFANGFSLKEIQEILGHATFRMTADIYSHLSEDVRKDWGERMQRAFA